MSKYVPVRCPECEEINFVSHDEWEGMMEEYEDYECENCGYHIDLHREYGQFMRRVRNDDDD